MTQAFNLAQLANNLNTSGQLDATDGLNGLVANANLASSGTASSSTYLRGDRTWATVTQKVLQVVQTTKTDTFTVANTDYVDVTGFSVSITPASTSNKILIMVHLHIDSDVGGYTNPWRIVRNTTPIAIGDSAGSRRLATGGGTSVYTTGPLQGVHQSAVWLDSPSSTSATTYKIQVATYTNSAGGVYINRGYNDADGANGIARYASSIIVMEIA